MGSILPRLVNGMQRMGHNQSAAPAPPTVGALTAPELLGVSILILARPAFGRVRPCSLTTPGPGDAAQTGGPKAHRPALPWGGGAGRATQWRKAAIPKLLTTL